MPPRKIMKIKKPAHDPLVWGKHLIKKRVLGRKNYLPGMQEIKKKATSSVAKEFFTSKTYYRRAQIVAELFNQSPQEFFEFWKRNAFNLTQTVRTLQKTKTVGKKEMELLADAFFAEYIPNALSEFVHGPGFPYSGILPPLSEGRYLQHQRKLAGTSAYKTYYWPIARMITSARNLTALNEIVDQILRGETLAHSRVRLLRDTSPLSDGTRAEGARLMTKKWEYAGRLQSLVAQGKKGEATRIRSSEILGRQLEVINEAHAALAMYHAPAIERILRKYLRQNRQPRVDSTAWTMLKLAQVAVNLNP